MICVARKTQEASPLNSRRSLQPTGGSGNNGKHSEGVPQRRNIGGASVSTGDPFRVDVKSITPFRGCMHPRLLSGDAFSVKQLRTSIMVGNFSDLYRTTKWLISDDEMAYFGWRNGLFRVLKSPLSGVNTAEAANVTCDMWHLACSQVSEKWKGRISYNIIFYIIYIIYNIYNISFQIS